MTLTQAIKLAIERNDLAAREEEVPSAMTYLQLREQLLTRRPNSGQLVRTKRKLQFRHTGKPAQEKYK
jgi:hypothetical protein